MRQLEGTGEGGGGRIRMGHSNICSLQHTEKEVQCLMFHVIPSIRPCISSTVHLDLEDGAAGSSAHLQI